MFRTKIRRSNQLHSYAHGRSNIPSNRLIYNHSQHWCTITLVILSLTPADDAIGKCDAASGDRIQLKVNLWGRECIVTDLPFGYFVACFLNR